MAMAARATAAAVFRPTGSPGPVPSGPPGGGPPPPSTGRTGWGRWGRDGGQRRAPPPPARMTAYIRPILRPAPLPNGNRTSRATGNLTIFHDQRTDRPSDALFAALPRRSSLVREIRRLPVDHRPRQHDGGS